MNTAGKHIVLLLPGLAGPVTDYPIGSYLMRRPAALDRLLSRAGQDELPGDDLNGVLLHYFGLDAATPVAPLTYMADTGRAPSGYVLRADPVHLRADQSSLRLFEAGSLAISQDEADALVAAFNGFYAERGWRLEAPVAERWYLLPDAVPAITTTPPAHVAGADIDAALPEGAGARDWHAILNEVQMLFHDHAVNRRREQHGAPLINSIWPWGGGTLPTGTLARVDRVIAADPLARALAGLTGAALNTPPDPAGELPAVASAGVTLAVVDTLDWPARYHDVERWIGALKGLEETLFAPLTAALAAGRITAIDLLPCNGRRFKVTRHGLRAFWRRLRPFEQVIAP